MFERLAGRALFMAVIVALVVTAALIATRGPAHAPQTIRVRTESVQLPRSVPTDRATSVGTAPSCAANGASSTTIAIAVAAGTRSFNQPCFYSPAGETLTLRFDNDQTLQMSHDPVNIQLFVFSNADAPNAFTSDGGFFTLDTNAALFKSDPVPGNSPPATFTLGPLAAGTYTIRAAPMTADLVATLTVA